MGAPIFTATRASLISLAIVSSECDGSHRTARSGSCPDRGWCDAKSLVAGARAQVYSGGDLRGAPGRTQSKMKWRRGDEKCALVCVGRVLDGGIADSRDGNGAECF